MPLSIGNRAELEARILGGILAWPASAPEAMHHLRDLWREAWSSPERRAVAAVVLDLLEARKAPDLYEVRGRLESAGADAARLLAGVTGQAEAPDVLGQRAAALASLIRVEKLRSTMALALARLDGEDIPDGDAFMSEVQHQLFGATPAGMNLRGSECVVQTVEEWYRDRAAAPSALTGVPLGLPVIDGITLGLQPGTSNIIGARPSHGKTALGGLVALNAAKAGHPVVFFSHEMSHEQIYRRMVALEACVSLRHAHRGCLRETSVGRWMAACRRIAALPLVIIDDSDASPLRCRFAAQFALARLQARWKKIPLLIVDYVQLQHIPNFRGDRQEEVAQISREWRITSAVTKAAVLMLAQLNRQADGREPKLSDLRESGSLEQDAHCTFLLWRPFKDRSSEDRASGAVGDSRKNAGANLAYLSLAKNRDGDLCEQLLHFSGFCMKFRPWLSNDRQLTGAEARMAEEAVWKPEVSRLDGALAAGEMDANEGEF